MIPLTRLHACLTHGWRSPEAAGVEARELARSLAARAPVGDSNVAYGHPWDRWTEQAAPSPPPPRVVRFERLVRRRPGGVETALSVLRALATRLPDPACVELEIDLFAYDYLAGTTDFDLLVSPAKDSPAAAIWPAWQAALFALQQFETEGRPPGSTAEVDVDHYLEIRSSVMRSDSNLLRRLLAALLVAGPSTTDELAQDVRARPDIVLQTLWVLAGSAAVAEVEDGLWVVAAPALPPVLFLLQSSLGLDPLARIRSVAMAANKGSVAWT